MRASTVWLLLLALLPLGVPAQSIEPQPLTVEELTCRGNTFTSCNFILGQLYLSAGDEVDEEEIENAKLRLSGLRNFKSVSIYLEKGSQRGLARVVVEVVEAENPVTTEESLGLISDLSSVAQVIGVRAAHDNVLGHGKIVDARAVSVIPVDGSTNQQLQLRAQYVDPHLFESKRTFASAGLSYGNFDIRRDNGDEFRLEHLTADVTIGRRLWDFSYLTFGYQYRPIADYSARIRQEGGGIETRDDLPTTGPVWGFGWNTQDDPYFPTQGSVAQFVFVPDDEVGGSSAFYRKSWSWKRSIWSLQLQTPNGLSVEIARPLPRLEELAGIRRGRWSLQYGVGQAGYTPDGRRIRTLGLRAGVLFETSSFGIVNLYLFGNTQWVP